MPVELIAICSKAINLSFQTIFNLAILPTNQRHTWQALVNLSVAAHSRSHVTKSVTFKFPFLGDSLNAKNLRHLLITFRDVNNQRILQYEWLGY